MKGGNCGKGTGFRINFPYRCTWLQFSSPYNIKIYYQLLENNFELRSTSLNPQSVNPWMFPRPQIMYRRYFAWNTASTTTSIKSSDTLRWVITTSGGHKKQADKRKDYNVQKTPVPGRYLAPCLSTKTTPLSSPLLQFLLNSTRKHEFNAEKAHNMNDT